MSYIGTPPAGQQFFSLAVERFNGDSACTEFTLARSVSNAVDIEVLVNNVQQDPDNAYTVASGVITFSEAPSTGTDNIIVTYRVPNTFAYQNINTEHLVDNAVTSNKIANNSITSDKIAPGTVIASDILDGSLTIAKFQSGTFPTAHSNSAYDAANTASATATAAGSYANSAFSTANTASATATAAGSYANSAFSTANTGVTNAATADSKAVSAGSYANSAFGVANTAATNITVIQGVNTTQNTNITTADAKATSAGSYANSAFTAANSRVSTANTNTFTANQTFTVANVTNQLISSGSASQNIIRLTDAATITPNLAQTNNFIVTLGGSRTMANATNILPGQSGVIFVQQDGTGSRTLSFGTGWRFPGNTAPTLTTTANAVDMIVYTAWSSSNVAAQAVLNVT
jgi:hypothetical protein